MLSRNSRGSKLRWSRRRKVVLTPLPKASNTLLDHALAYGERGWSIISVIGKRAAGQWKPFQHRPADKPTLRRMFANAGITGLAVVTGAVSGGLAIRDFDHASAYEAWAKIHAEDAASLPTVKTARGYHVYGRLDSEQYATLDDGELRSDSKHYVVLPPSHHPNGTPYTWLVPLPPVGTSLPILPDGLAAIAQVTPCNPSNPIACVTSVEQAIARTLPTAPGQRNRRLFDLARQLKGIMPEADGSELRAIVREWHRQALGVIRTKDFGESWSDFTLAWQNIRRPAGQSFAAAVATTHSDDIPPVLQPLVKQLGYDGHLRTLLVLCWSLQRQWGENPFPLSGRKAAEALDDISHVHAWRLLKTLQFDRVITLVSQGSKAKAKANEYRFKMLPASLLTEHDDQDGPYREGL